MESGLFIHCEDESGKDACQNRAKFFTGKNFLCAHHQSGKMGGEFSISPDAFPDTFIVIISGMKEYQKRMKELNQEYRLEKMLEKNYP